MNCTGWTHLCQQDAAYAEFKRACCDSCLDGKPRPKEWRYVGDVRERIECQNERFVARLAGTPYGLRFRTRIKGKTLQKIKSHRQAFLLVWRQRRKENGHCPTMDPRNQIQFTLNPAASKLLQIFEGLARQQEHYELITRRMRYDRLGIYDALLQLESDLNRGLLPEPQRLVPLLEQIADDPITWMWRESARACWRTALIK